jgi:hypothetical protein
MPWVLPLIFGELYGFGFFKGMVFLMYKSIEGWASFFSLTNIMIQDYNASVMSSLMHTMIYPASFIYWAMNESDIEQPDFDALEEDEQTLNFL